MRVLITGGAGFLGAACAAEARRRGHAVATVDRRGAVDFALDIADAAAVANVVRDVSPEVVVHLAAVLTDAAAADAVAATRINALGTAAVFAAAVDAGVRQVVYASSVAAVGWCVAGAGDDVALTPRSTYGATKAFGEHLARALAGGNQPGSPVRRDAPAVSPPPAPTPVISESVAPTSAAPTSVAPAFIALRLGWVYGPGRERGWRTAQAVIERFARGDREVVYPDYPDPLDWTWIDDAVDVLVSAIERPFEGFNAFNVVGDRRTMREAVAHLERRFPAARGRPEPARTPPSAWGLVNDGLEAALGRVPSTRVEDGIDRMLAAFAEPVTAPTSPAVSGKLA